MIAVEGDWPPSRQVTRYIKGYEDSDMTTIDALKAFNRWQLGCGRTKKLLIWWTG